MIKKIISLLSVFAIFFSATFPDNVSAQVLPEIQPSKITVTGAPQNTGEQSPVGSESYASATQKYTKLGTIGGQKPPVFSTSSAGISEKSSPNFSISPLKVGEIKLDKQKYSAGDVASGTIAIINENSVDKTDVYLDISLAGNYGTSTGKYNIPSTIYDTKSFGPFTVKGGTVTNIPFLYAMPDGIGGKGLGININTRSISGLPYGWSDAQLGEVTGGVEMLTVKDAHIAIGTEKHTPQSGPMIYATTSAKFHLTVSNQSKKSITVTPDIQIHERLSSGKLINKSSDKTVTIASGQKYDFVFEPVKNDINPGVYVADVYILDSNNQARSQLVQFRYIIPGEIVTIQDVQVNKNSVSEGDSVKVTVAYSGTPFDINSGNRQEIKDATIKIQVLDSKSNAVLGEESLKPDLGLQIGTLDANIKVNQSAESVKVVATIEKDGKVLASYTSSATEPDLENNRKNKNIFDISLKWIILGAVLLILIFVILYFVRSKNSNKVLMGIIIALTVVGGGFTANKYADAYIVYQESWIWGITNYGTGNFKDSAWNSIVLTSPQKIWVTSGEPVTVSGYVYSFGCNNTPEDLWVTVKLLNASGANVSGDQTMRFRYENTGSHSYANNYSNFSFNIPTGFAPGTYYIDVSTYEHWHGNTIWEHAGTLVDRTNLYIYPPAVTACAPDKTTAYVGEPVTWVQYPIGGTGSFRYFWAGDWINNYFEGSQTYTTSYSTPGSWGITAALLDNYTQHNSGWRVCNSRVNVIDKASAVPLTSTCSVSKTSVKINEPVTWTITASGGIPPYTGYVWSENSEIINARTQSVTRSYSTPGQVSMAYIVQDSYSGSQSASLNFNDFCPQQVTVTAELDGSGACTGPDGSSIANGATRRYFTSSGPTCGDYADFTCTNGTLSAGNKNTYKFGECSPNAEEADIAPILITAKAASTIELTFDKELDPKSVPSGSAFSVATTVNVPVNNVSISGNVVTLSTGTNFTGTGVLSVRYTPPSSNPLQSLKGTDVLPFSFNFKDKQIINFNYTNNPPVTIISFSMRPDIVNKNNPCGMNLKVQNAKSCTLTGKNINPQSSASTDSLDVTLYNEGETDTSLSSGAIQETTRFTLSCKGQAKDSTGDYPVVSRSAQCFLNPASTER